MLPQLIANPREVDSFATVATSAGACFVHLVLRDPSGAPADRFRRRAGNDPWHAEVRRLVAEAGSARRSGSRYAPSLALGGYSTTEPFSGGRGAHSEAFLRDVIRRVQPLAPSV